MAKRIVFLDYVRVAACFLVMVVHASENFYAGPGSTDMAGPVSLLANESDRLWVSVYDGLSRISVPLFMIVSAFLLVPLKEGQSTFAFYRRRARRILPAFFFFILVYACFPHFTGDFQFDGWFHDLTRAPLNFPDMAGHLWFMYPLIGLYLFIPVISPWLAKTSRREEQFFIGLFAVSTCMPYLNRFFGEVWGQCFWNEFHLLWYFSGYLGYLVLAHYIRVHLDWSRKKRLAMGSILTVAGASWTILSFYVQAVPEILHETPVIEIGWSFCTINCLMFTTGVFLLFTCIRKERTPGIVAELSDLSYGMYLMHILWLGLWVKVIKTDLSVASVAAIPLIAVATFLSSWISTKLLSLIPGFKALTGVSSSSGKKENIVTA